MPPTHSLAKWVTRESIHLAIGPVSNFRKYRGQKNIWNCTKSMKFQKIQAGKLQVKCPGFFNTKLKLKRWKGNFSKNVERDQICFSG